MPEILVTNHNRFELRGRYAAQNYVFYPDKPLAIPEDAAKHIFALGQESKTGAYNRLGLLKPGDSIETAQRVIDQVEFSQGRTVFETPEPPVPQPSPQPDRDDEPEENGDNDQIGGSPGAQRCPGGESGEDPASPGTLARKVMARRHAGKIPIGG